MGKAGRLNSGKCLMCGSVLIVGSNELPIAGPYQCCTKCTDFIERKRYELKKKVENKRNIKGIPLRTGKLLKPIKVMGPDAGGVKFGPF